MKTFKNLFLVGLIGLLGFCAKRQENRTKKKDVVLISAGDIFLHEAVLKAHQDGENKFDFTDCFRFVDSSLLNADISTLWFEGAVDTKGPYTGYPRFKSPTAIATAMKEAGIDIVFPSNHVMDYGEEGLMRTIKIFDSLGLKHTGAYKSEDESNRILVIEKDSIRIAFLSYTYGTNELPIHKPFMVNLIDSVKIRNDIVKAKKLADFVVVALHFGKQYKSKPDSEQKQIALQVVLSGADLIVGSHCHVVQPAAVMKLASDSAIWDVFVEYCVGNFLCNQRTKNRDIGIMLRYVVEKDFSKDSTYLKGIAYIPICILRIKKDKRYKYVILPVRYAISKWEEGGLREFMTKQRYERLKKTLKDLTAILDRKSIGYALYKD